MMIWIIAPEACIQISVMKIGNNFVIWIQEQERRSASTVNTQYSLSGLLTGEMEKAFVYSDWWDVCGWVYTNAIQNREKHTRAFSKLNSST